MYLLIYVSIFLFIVSALSSVYGLFHHSMVAESAAIAFSILSYIALALEKLGE